MKRLSTRRRQDGEPVSIVAARAGAKASPVEVHDEGSALNLEPTEQVLAGRETVRRLDAVSRRGSDALRALSHESRLMILCLLRDCERSVGEIEAILELPQPAVSQQLARLRLDDLVTCRRDGRTIYYTLDPARIDGIWRDLGVMLGYISETVLGVEADRVAQDGEDREASLREATPASHAAF